MRGQQHAAAGRPTAIVTGVTSAIGAAAAAALARRGYRVFGTARRPEAEQMAVIGGEIEVLALDVTDPASVSALLECVLARAGRIDVLVNNAGVTVVGAAEELSEEEARAVVETNLMGVHRMSRAVLPAMRAQCSGRIITIGSVAGFLPKPFEAFYSATKHAVEGYVESLHHEVRDFGIQLSIVQPGYVNTRFSANASPAERRLAAYRRPRAAIDEKLQDGVASGIEPDAVARAVVRAATARFPRLRYRPGWQARRFGFERWLAPQRLFDFGVRVHYGLFYMLPRAGIGRTDPARQHLAK